MAQSGVITQPVKFERKIKSPDGLNGRIGVPTIVCCTLGEVTPIQAKRSLEAAQMTLKAAYTLKVRNNPSFVPLLDDLVIIRDQRFAIKTKAFNGFDRMWYVFTLIEVGDDTQS